MDTYQKGAFRYMRFFFFCVCLIVLFKLTLNIYYYYCKEKKIKLFILPSKTHCGRQNDGPPKMSTTKTLKYVNISLHGKETLQM